MLEFLENYCKGLQEIYLTHCVIPEDEHYGLVQLISHPNMKSINRIHLHNSTIGGVWLGYEIPLVQTREPNGGQVHSADAMQFLVIQNDRLPKDKAETSALGGLLRLCPNLTTLHLRMECDSMYFPEIQSAIYRLRKLDSLEIGTFGPLVMMLLSRHTERKLRKLAILDMDPRALDVLAIESEEFNRFFTCDALTLEYEVSSGMKPVDVEYITKSFKAKSLTLRIGSEYPSAISGQYSIEDLKRRIVNAKVDIFMVSRAPKLLPRGKYDRDFSPIIVPSTSERKPDNWTAVLPSVSNPFTSGHHWADVAL